MPIRRRSYLSPTLVAIALGLLFPPCASDARAQAYPAKPIQLVIPYPPGGSDVLPRRLIIGIAEKLGVPIVPVNKPGASTQIASAFAASAAPDGYTIYFANATELAAGPALFKTLPFNALTDFTPISFIADAPYALVASSALGPRSLADLVAFVKANPGKAKVASYGVQSQNDITARRFNAAYGTDVQIIPYQGGSPALNAVVRNEVQLVFVTLIPSRAFIVAGQMVPLAIASEQRVSLYPDVPTFRELGHDIIDSASFALFGPKGMNPEIVKRLNDAFAAELKKPDIIKFMDGLGIVPVGSSPAALGKRLQDSTAQWAEIASKLRLEKQ